MSPSHWSHGCHTNLLLANHCNSILSSSRRVNKQMNTFRHHPWAACVLCTRCNIGTINQNHKLGGTRRYPVSRVAVMMSWPSRSIKTILVNTRGRAHDITWFIRCRVWPGWRQHFVNDSLDKISGPIILCSHLKRCFVVTDKQQGMTRMAAWSDNINIRCLWQFPIAIWYRTDTLVFCYNCNLHLLCTFPFMHLIKHLFKFLLQMELVADSRNAECSTLSLTFKLAYLMFNIYPGVT